MAKSPGTPKAKTAAPAQFDMNSRERKGGKGGPGGPGRGRDRDEKRPPSRIESLPPVLVDRGEGWVIRKIGKIDQASHTAAGAEYQLVFEGHDPMSFNFLGAARERAKEAPPEKAQVEEVAAAEAPEGDVEDAAEAEPASDEQSAEEHPAEEHKAADAT